MNKLISRILVVLLCLAMVAAIVLPVFAADNDEEEPAAPEQKAPLSIDSSEEFLVFAENCRLDSFSQGLTVTLTADIDLTGLDFEGIPIFCGTLLGQGHRIFGLDMTHDGSYQGLFRYLTTTALVEGLHVEGNVHPQGTCSAIGGIAGSNEGLIRNCTFRGEVSGSDRIGGLVGFNSVSGTIENCTVFGAVHGNHFVGGLTGENYGVVRGSRNEAEINVTENQNRVDISDITLDTMSGTEAAGTVTDIGGITGLNSGVVRSCRNDGNVGYPHMGYNIGGIAGSQTGFLADCENHGTISGRKEVGGIVGQMEPISRVEYTLDTLQILQQQMSTTSALANRIAGTARNQASGLIGQVAVLQDQAKVAMDALETLKPEEGEHHLLPDPDKLAAARNAITGSLQAMHGTMNSITSSAQSSVEAISSDVGALSGQIHAMGSTIGNATEYLGVDITDVSDEDSPEDLTCKVQKCLNSGLVQGDINVGGIVGAVSWENDMDPEDDLKISGDPSLNFKSEVRAVVLGCRNDGTITVKKRNAGGIAGWLSLGLIKDSINSGNLDAPGGQYVGGIAGASSGFIRSCSAKSQITGSIHVGGIAGSGSVVTDCRSMVSIENTSEKQGAILGSLAYQTHDLEFPIAGNLYLPAGNDLGGIDGISYDGLAQPMPREEFFALPELPQDFAVSHVIFLSESGSKTVRTLRTGDTLEPDQVPEVPQKSGYNGIWDDPEHLRCSPVYFDLTISPAYTAFQQTIRSRRERDAGSPLLLALGSFDHMDYFDTEPLEDLPPVPEKFRAIEGWTVPSLSDTDSVEVRFTLPEGIHSGHTHLLIRDGSGSWRESEFTENKSCLVFSLQPGDNALCLAVKAHITHWGVYAGEAVLAATVIFIVAGSVLRHWEHKPRKKKN